MSNTATAYQFDGQGYFLNETIVQKFGNEYLIPSDTTMVKPEPKQGYWCKWDGSKWVDEKIPTTCEEALNLTCISNGQGKHNYEIRTLLEYLVSQDSEHYKTVVDENFNMSIEAIPEPTEEEKIAKLSAELRAKRDAELDATDFYLMSDYPISGSDLALIQRYRQELRDLPQQEGFPYVDFPVNPLTSKVEE